MQQAGVINRLAKCVVTTRIFLLPVRCKIKLKAILFTNYMTNLQARGVLLISDAVRNALR